MAIVLFWPGIGACVRASTMQVGSLKILLRLSRAAAMRARTASSSPSDTAKGAFTDPVRFFFWGTLKRVAGGFPRDPSAATSLAREPSSS